ncbi:MAG TPA: hypothetical protein VMW52_07900 [Phycisphaerae bacterium]|nr:hypothetical protein [Phycisphaerae bacterium]
MATKLWLGNDVGNEGDLSVAANWSPVGVPVNGDDVMFYDSDQAVSGGLNQSAVTPGSIRIYHNYTGLFGLGDTPVQWGGCPVYIGEHWGAGNPVGSARINLDLGSGSAATIEVFNGCLNSEDGDVPPIRLLTAHASSVLRVRKGRVGVASGVGQTAQLSKIVVGYAANRQSDADVVIGSGVTLATLDVTGGRCVLLCAATTVNVSDGQLRAEGSGAIATVNADGGRLRLNSSGTITTLNLGPADVDLLGSEAARTITTINPSAGGSLALDKNVVTITNKLGFAEPLKITFARP